MARLLPVLSVAAVLAGALAVPSLAADLLLPPPPVLEGDEVVEPLNKLIDKFLERGEPVYKTRDWHPSETRHFVAYGGTWPVHCVQDSPGARFHPALTLPTDTLVVTKGVRFDRDQYSAFDETGLAAELRKRGVRRVWVGGLAQDVCVRATVLDARREGFDVILIADATRPVTPDGGERAIEEMRQAGARVETAVGVQ